MVIQFLIISIYHIDKFDKWNEIHEQWLNDFINQEERPGQCVRACVTAEDEWCAEAYLKTNYNNLTKSSFNKNMKAISSFNLLNMEE